MILSYILALQWEGQVSDASLVVLRYHGRGGGRAVGEVGGVQEEVV